MSHTSAHELVSGWLADMAPSIGMNLELDEDGRCAVEFPDSLVVVLSAGQDRYALMSALAESPSESNPRTLEQALRLNLDYSRTRGGSLGFFEPNHELVYIYHRELDALDNAENFTNRFMNFISTAYDLRAELLVARDAEIQGAVPGFSSDQGQNDPEDMGIEPAQTSGGLDPMLTRVMP